MDSDFYFDSFFFCSRNELEGLQLVRKSLRNKIDSGSKVLPLRPIYCVDMVFNGSEDKIRIFASVGGFLVPDYEASVDDGDHAETFSRLQNTCIKYFCVGIRDSPFLRYWQGREDAAFTVVSIRFHLEDDTDYGVLDSIVNHVRPKTTSNVVLFEPSWHKNGFHSDYLELLSRDSFLNSLETCSLSASGAFPPPAFFLEPGYPNYEVWCNECPVADGIDAFIESFVRYGCANKKLESVCILWEVDEKHPSPAPKQLSMPTKTDMPPPKAAVEAFMVPATHRVSQCEMHAFVNTKQCKHMEVCKWTVEYDCIGRRHTAHILQCRVQNF